MNPSPRPRPEAPELPFPGPASGVRSEFNNGLSRHPEAEPRHWDHCPNCGGRLVNQRCKYRCPRCFYFMSCADFG